MVLAYHVTSAHCNAMWWCIPAPHPETAKDALKLWCIRCKWNAVHILSIRYVVISFSVLFILQTSKSHRVLGCLSVEEQRPVWKQELIETINSYTHAVLSLTLYLPPLSPLPPSPTLHSTSRMFAVSELAVKLQRVSNFTSQSENLGNPETLM